MNTKRAITLSLIAGSIVATHAQAQRYQKAYGLAESHEEAHDVTRAFPSADGLPPGAITVGASVSGALTPVTDLLAIRHGPTGGIVWSEIIDFGGRTDAAYSVWPLFKSSPMPHYAVAGVTDAFTPGAGPGMETLVTRLSPSGGVVWSGAYMGTFPSATDLVHAFRRGELGTQVVEYPDGSLVVIGNLFGRPLVMRLDGVSGTPLVIASYPSPMPEVEIGITDVRVVGDLILVAGSIEQEFGPTAPPDVDVFAMLLAPDLSVITTGRYHITASKPGGDFRSSEWGHALAESATDSAMIISGVTDYRDPAPPFARGQAAPFTLAIDPMTLTPIVWFTYDPLLGAAPPAGGFPRWYNGYGAQVFDPRTDRNTLAGTFVDSGGGERSSAFEVDPFAGSIAWSQRYARTTTGRGVDIADPACGVFVAGRIDGTTPPLSGVTGPAADHLAKTNAMGLTNCSESRIELLTIPAQFQRLEVPLTATYHDNFARLDPQLVSEVTEDRLCESATCSCPGDIADDFGTLGPDGMVSFGDFLALLGLVGPCPGLIPGCTGDIADSFGFLVPDGTVDFGDFLALLGLVGPCP